LRTTDAGCVLRLRRIATTALTGRRSDLRSSPEIVAASGAVSHVVSMFTTGFHSGRSPPPKKQTILPTSSRSVEVATHQPTLPIDATALYSRYLRPLPDGAHQVHQPVRAEGRGRRAPESRGPLRMGVHPVPRRPRGQTQGQRVHPEDRDPAGGQRRHGGRTRRVGRGAAHHPVRGEWTSVHPDPDVPAAPVAAHPRDSVNHSAATGRGCDRARPR